MKKKKIKAEEALNAFDDLKANGYCKNCNCRHCLSIRFFERLTEDYYDKGENNG